MGTISNLQDATGPLHEPAMLDVLAIDDDRVAQKFIGKALGREAVSLRFADSGEQGLARITERLPDIVILDVEMPGLSGYEVCQRIRENPGSRDVPVVFLSSHSSLRERMQGYEVGANDYLVKPFEPPDLAAKIRVLAKYREEQLALRDKYEQARRTAQTALTATSELGVAMHYVEKSYGLRSFDELASELFASTDRFGIDCVLMIFTDTEPRWFASDGSISPLEKELIEMSERERRFIDFGSRTIVNFSHTSLLVKNMPLEDMERYGRVKDLIPILLSAVNAKVNTLETEQALIDQSHELLRAFGQIKTRFYYFAKTLLHNQRASQKMLESMINELTFDFLKMGLDEDQEEFVVQRIEQAIDRAMLQIDASHTLYETFSVLLQNIREITSRQQSLVDSFEDMHVELDQVDTVEDDGIELF